MQVDTGHGSNIEILLQEILREITQNPDLYPAITKALETMCGLTGAAGALFATLTDSQITIQVGTIETPDDRLQPLLHSLLDDSSVEFYRNAHHSDDPSLLVTPNVIVPIRTASTLMAGVVLTFKDDPHITESDFRQLLPLIDGITIAAALIEHRYRQEMSQRLASSLLKTITDPLLVLDESRHLVLMNPAAERVFKISLAEAQGKLLKEVILSDELMELTQGKNTSLKEWTNEDNMTFVPRTEPIRDHEGHLEGWVLALRDITHFKKLNRNQNEFTRIVSHDLRSPLTSMQGFASMLELGLVGDLNEKQKHFIEKILNGISQMTALVDNIQDAGRYDPETGFYEILRSHCDLSEMVRRISETHLMPAEKQELAFKVDIAPDLPIINADINMLERAVTNLIDNAIKYTPNGGQINVGVKRHEDTIQISVKDTGLGISPEHQKHLFERHVRIPRQEHKKIKGSGLGLFIVKSVAQRHGGDAWVNSIEGEGSTFFMSIPLSGPNLISTQE